MSKKELIQCLSSNIKMLLDDKGSIAFIKEDDYREIAVKAKKKLAQALLSQIGSLDIYEEKVDIPKIVDKIRSTSEEPMYSLVSLSDKLTVHVTSKDIKKLVYDMTAEQAEALLSHYVGVEEVANYKDDQNLIRFMLEDMFDILQHNDTRELMPVVRKLPSGDWRIRGIHPAHKGE